MMKPGYNLFPIAVSLLMLFSFTDGILQQLALSEGEAKESIRTNFMKGELYVPDNKTIKGLAVAKRALTVKELGGYIRQYLESQEFNKAYQEARAAARPAGKGDLKALINERLSVIGEELKDAEEKVKTASSDIKKLYELSVNQLKQERDALKNSTHPMHKDYVANLEEESEESITQRKMAADYFNKDYPPTVRELIQLRLQKFLEVSASIDFNAKLVQQGQVTVFADPALEAKDGNWKKLFRTGPETIGAARLFAKQWLQDLQKSGGL
jgi:hypothetical protein